MSPIELLRHLLREEDRYLRVHCPHLAEVVNYCHVHTFTFHCSQARALGGVCIRVSNEGSRQ